MKRILRSAVFSLFALIAVDSFAQKQKFDLVEPTKKLTAYDAKCLLHCGVVYHLKAGYDERRSMGGH